MQYVTVSLVFFVAAGRPAARLLLAARESHFPVLGVRLFSPVGAQGCVVTSGLRVVTALFGKPWHRVPVFFFALVNTAFSRSLVLRVRSRPLHIATTRKVSFTLATRRRSSYIVGFTHSTGTAHASRTVCTEPRGFLNNAERSRTPNTPCQPGR